MLQPAGFSPVLNACGRVQHDNVIPVETEHTLRLVKSLAWSVRRPCCAGNRAISMDWNVSFTWVPAVVTPKPGGRAIPPPACSTFASSVSCMRPDTVPVVEAAVIPDSQEEGIVAGYADEQQSPSAIDRTIRQDWAEVEARGSTVTLIRSLPAPGSLHPILIRHTHGRGGQIPGVDVGSHQV